MTRSPMPFDEPLLRVSGLTKRYGGLVANDSIDLTLRKGHVMGIIGPNGAGKSTLVGLIGGATAATAGSIHFAGRDITRAPPPERARLGIGRTYQIPRPFLDMTVAENLKVAQIAIAPWAHAPTAAAERDAILHDTGLSAVADVKARMLPLLRRKRLEVARALALKPKLLLLDEVGAGLIDAEVTELIALIKTLADGERSIIVIEHIMRVIAECCEDLAVLNFGRKLTEGRTADVLASEEVGAVYLGAAHGRTLAASCAAPVAAHVAAAPMLELAGLSAGYGQAKVLHGVDLVVAQGAAVAILGANGAGKTTLANVIGRSLRETSGSLRFAGRDLAPLRAHEAFAAGIAHCMEGRRIFPSLSVEENLALAGRGATPADLQRRLARIYDLFPVLAERRRSGGVSMSGGQQQMLAIGRALMSAPKLVIFDEISLGLAPIMLDRLYDALARLKAEGLTMVIVEQDVERALALADHAHVLAKGRIVLSGASAVVRADGRLKQSYLGLEG